MTSNTPSQPNAPVKQLILGGARSGKSSYAEQRSIELAEAHNLDRIYIATATAGDSEMSARIQRHQTERGQGWRLIEEPFDLSCALSQNEAGSGPGINSLRSSEAAKSVILIDCLTLWLSNCLHAHLPLDWPHQKAQFIQTLNASHNHIIMVSNEVGQGIIPMGNLTRRYVDEMGWLHQDLARECNHVTMVVAGLAQQLKQP